MSFVPGTNFYRKQTKYTILATNPVRTTIFRGFLADFLSLNSLKKGVDDDDCFYYYKK